MKIYRTISYILFCLFGILLVLVFSGSNGTPEQDFNTLVVAVSAFILGCGFMLYYRYGKKPWNEMSFDEQCRQMAKEIKAGKRNWFLMHDGVNFLAVPLSPSNMNQFGYGTRIDSNLEKVKHYMGSGQIKNDNLVTTILKFLEQK